MIRGGTIDECAKGMFGYPDGFQDGCEWAITQLQQRAAIYAAFAREYRDALHDKPWLAEALDSCAHLARGLGEAARYLHHGGDNL